MRAQLTAEQRTLIERYVPLAEATARRRRFEHEDLDDVRSDSLWGLSVAARTYRPGPAGFAQYARMRMEGAIRRGRQARSGVPRLLWEASQRTLPRSLDAPLGLDTHDTLADQIPAPATHPDLAAAIDALPPRERATLTLHYIWGLSDREIGGHLGCHQVHASRIKRTGLQRLRDQLSG